MNRKQEVVEMVESERLIMRKLTSEDKEAISVFLSNPQVMYAWEHGLSEEEIDDWLQRNIARYKKDGCGYLLAQEKASGEVVGAIGLIYNDIDGHMDWEVAYILDEKYWGKGYALEGACACVEYAFKELGANRVIVQMRVNNMSSRKVAERLGAAYQKEYVRNYHGANRDYAIYCIQKDGAKE